MSAIESDSPNRWILGNLRQDRPNNVCPNNIEVLRSFYFCMDTSKKREQKQSIVSNKVADSLILERTKLQLLSKPKWLIVGQINKLVDQYRGLLKMQSSLDASKLRKRETFESQLQNVFDLTPTTIDHVSDIAMKSKNRKLHELESMTKNTAELNPAVQELDHEDGASDERSSRKRRRRISGRQADIQVDADIADCCENPVVQELSQEDGASDERSSRKRRRRISGRQADIQVDADCCENPVVQELSQEDGASEEHLRKEAQPRTAVGQLYVQSLIKARKVNQKKSPNLLKKIVSSPKVSSVIDRLNLSDNQGVMMIGVVADAIGIDVSEGTLSQSTLRRYRGTNRIDHDTIIEQDLNLKNTPLIVHWDGKKLPDATNKTDPKSKVERHGVVVTGMSFFYTFW
jgi:hypothetical protein